MPGHDHSGVPWGLSIAAALPGFGLAVAGGALGPSSPAGIALLACSVVYLAVGLAVIQPRLLGGNGHSEDAAGEFLQRALGLRDVIEIAQEFAIASKRATGASRALLVVATPAGARVVGDSGTHNDALDAAEAAFVWLSERSAPISRAELQQLGEFPGASDTLALFDALGCDVGLPLRHRGVLLGLGAVGGGALRSTGTAEFYKTVRAYLTAAVANTYLHAEAHDSQQLSRTFDLASAMQESLMPDELAVRRPTFELRGVFRPVEQCGGDLWVWRELSQGRLLFVIGDATGHGAAPAMLAAVAKGAIDAHWQLMGGDLDPAELLVALNRSVHRAGRTRYMMTAFAAVLDKQRQELRYANAGQNFPYVITAERELHTLVARGNSLGAAADVSYQAHTRQFNMGDKLVLFTDGLTDAGSPSMEPYGERRFRAALQSLAGERATRIAPAVLDQVNEYVGTAELCDDITMAVAEFGPTGAPSEEM